MHRIFIISVGLILLCCLVRAETGFYPSPLASYGTGFLRVEPATGIPGRTLNIVPTVRGFTYTPRGAGNPYRGGSLVLGMDYGIVDNFAVRLWVPFYLDMEPDWDNKAGGFGDVRIGLKYSVEDVFAIQNFLLVPTGKGLLGPENGEGRFRYFTTGGVDFGVKAILSYDIENVKLSGGGEYIHHGLKDLYIGQLGASFDLEKFQPFVEFVGEDRGGFDGDDGECAPDISYITPGLVFNPNPNLSILFAIDVRVTWAVLFGGVYPEDWRNDYYVTAGPGKSQPWAVNLGVKYTLGKPRIEKTMVEGGVIDAETGEPVRAEISFPGTELNSIRTDKYGKFKISLAGKQTVMLVLAEGYGSLKKTVILKPGATTDLIFALAPENVTIMGKVMDRETGEPIHASIMLEGMEPVTTDMNGDYSLNAEPGTYTPRAKSEDYISAAREITLKKGKVARVNFFLIPTSTISEGGLRLEKSAPLKIQFIYGKTTLTETGKNKLDKLALTLIQNPGLGLEVRNYIGEGSYSNLSRKRIEVVKNYLTTRGISTDQLSP
ncbi:hypothetical protein CH333_02050 [candidate division WOR-3 bacterium JGI_Cruoil_03_44_89]|uniref:OmpA-like domain-containing protein n=1 Tax=candidate division WOR-3 bacterium JGI_Cruoil_03_44_89 TaxID=1973748 RepID=A0A235BXV9_UNCW3|nr:MAG: hypothetical protein CH333_02050 [candidate division WOR-3 bacterium JGI_Cruoil_03_44_89]